jgi:hypothetical protein
MDGTIDARNIGGGALSEAAWKATLWKLARGLTWASLLVSLPLLPKTPLRIAGALLGTAGGLALRLALVGVGRAQAEDTEVVLDLEV